MFNVSCMNGSRKNNNKKIKKLNEENNPSDGVHTYSNKYTNLEETTGIDDDGGLFDVFDGNNEFAARGNKIYQVQVEETI